MSAKPLTYAQRWERFERAAYDGPNGYAPAQSGDWQIEKSTVTEEEAKFERMRATFHGDRRYTPAGHYTGLKCGRALIMSNVPDEIRDLRPLFEHATGTVLVNGLGLGCALWGLLTMPEVEHVTVVEKSSDVLKLVAPYFEKSGWADRVTFVEADAFTVQWEKGRRWNVVWHDIWNNLCTDDLKEHAKLKRRYAQRCDWQGAWCEDYLRYQRERGR